MRDMDLSDLLEQTPIRNSFLPHLSRSDLQSLGQTNSANRRAVYSRPLELPSAAPVSVISDGNLYLAKGGFLDHNPAYIREVRQIVSGTHPHYYPWQLGEAGISNPSALRIVSRRELDRYTDHIARHGRPRLMSPLQELAEADYQWLHSRTAQRPASPPQEATIRQRTQRCRIL